MKTLVNYKEVLVDRMNAPIFEVLVGVLCFFVRFLRNQDT